MKTFVTGGTGFIGGAVVQELLRRGQEVRVLVRDPTRPGNLTGLEVELVPGDVRDKDSVYRGMKGCSRVYHLAAIYAIWLPDPRVMYAVNVEGTRHVLEACLIHGVERVVYTSSTAALGAHGKTPADETAQFNLWHTRDHYFISKYKAEQVALEYAAKGLPVVIVNPTVPVGPGDLRPTPSGAMILNVLKGRLPGYVDGGINLVDVRDVAMGHILAMEKGRIGEKYILGNQNISVKEFFDLVAEIGGGRAPSWRFPVALAVLFGYIYELLARLTGRPPLTSASWVRVGSQYSFWDCRKAVQELGMPQRPIRQSIADAVAWFRERGYLEGG